MPSYTITHVNSNGDGLEPGATFTQGALFDMLWRGLLPHGATVECDGIAYEVRAWIHPMDRRYKFAVRQWLRLEGDAGLWPCKVLGGGAVKLVREMPVGFEHGGGRWA